MSPQQPQPAQPAPTRPAYPTRRPGPTTPVAPPRPTRSPTRVHADLGAEIEAYVDELVAAAPPFTREQEDHLRAIFAPAYERLTARRVSAAA
ncbi:hypothetical protein [Amycolatopsis plumensis]|uniref:Uncharacterized protein n=2 Tax=Amycolatopsis plumensis TaxID=236508 RepID=A0ABV5U8F6_9PSEU